MNRSNLRRALDSEGLKKADKNRIVIKPEDLPKNRLGPEVNQMYHRKTRFDDTDADFARGKGRREKHKKPWTDRESTALRSILSSEGLLEQ